MSAKKLLLLEQDYMSANFTIEQLTKKYGITPIRLGKYVKEFGWKPMTDTISGCVNSYIAEQSADFLAKNLGDDELVGDIIASQFRVDKAHYDAYEEILAALNVILETGKQRKRFAGREVEIPLTIEDYKNISITLGNIQKGQRVSIGADKLTPDAHNIYNINMVNQNMMYEIKQKIIDNTVGKLTDIHKMIESNYSK